MKEVSGYGFLAGWLHDSKRRAAADADVPLMLMFRWCWCWGKKEWGDGSFFCPVKAPSRILLPTDVVQRPARIRYCLVIIAFLVDALSMPKFTAKVVFPRSLPAVAFEKYVGLESIRWCCLQFTLMQLDIELWDCFSCSVEKRLLFLLSLVFPAPSSLSLSTVLGRWIIVW